MIAQCTCQADSELLCRTHHITEAVQHPKDLGFAPRVKHPPPWPDLIEKHEHMHHTAQTTAAFAQYGTSPYIPRKFVHIWCTVGFKLCKLNLQHLGEEQTFCTCQTCVSDVLRSHMHF